MEEIITRLMQLPAGIKGMIVLDREGDFNIYINSRMSLEQQLLTYSHELEHITNGDYNRSGLVDLIEIRAHMAE